jgi:hypothetical protein
VPISQPGFGLPDVNQTDNLFQHIRGSGQKKRVFGHSVLCPKAVRRAPKFVKEGSGSQLLKQSVPVKHPFRGQHQYTEVSRLVVRIAPSSTEIV